MRRRKHLNPHNVSTINLVYFPIGRSKGIVAAVAAALDASRSDGESKRVWKAYAQRQANALWQVGASQAEIDFHIEELASAVCWELTVRAASQ